LIEEIDKFESEISLESLVSKFVMDVLRVEERLSIVVFIEEIEEFASEISLENLVSKFVMDVLSVEERF
jgi:hypothetical protein